MNRNAKDMLVFALDVPGEEAPGIIESIGGDVGWMKMNSVFLEAYILLAEKGINLIELIKKKGARIFLDLKWHDIPNTIENYVRVACKMGVKMFNLHTQGSIAMMKKAVDTVNEIYKDNPREKPIILAVTLLTSIDQKVLEEELGHKVPLKKVVVTLAENAKKAGCDGVVASTHEVKEIKEACGKDFKVLTPAIKFEEELSDKAKQDDQKRKATPKLAVEEGSDFVVMGRSLLKGGKEAVLRALREIEEGLTKREAEA